MLGEGQRLCSRAGGNREEGQVIRAGSAEGHRLVCTLDSGAPAP